MGFSYANPRAILLGDTWTVYFGDDDPVTHTFGGQSSDLDNGNEISSLYTVNTSDTARAVDGGFYRFDIDYAAGQGIVDVVIAGIDWVGGDGGIASVFVSDTFNTGGGSLHQ